MATQRPFKVVWPLRTNACLNHGTTAAASGERAEVLVNRFTDQPFHTLRVRTFGGTFDVVAHPSLVADEPQVGGVAQGNFWLSARVAPASGDVVAGIHD